MTPRVRKLALTAHVASSVGWLGAVAGFLALAVAGLTSENAELVRAAYLTMEAIGWFVLVPLAAASLLTGLVESFATKWGLFRHYWVIAKLLINVFATVVLLVYMETLRALGAEAAETTSTAELEALRSASPVVHATGAMLLLLVATALAVYKPPGVTPYGQRKQHERRPVPQP